MSYKYWYFIQYQNVKMQQKCILEARCNDKVSKSVKIYWLVIAYNERLLHTWIRHTKNVWFLHVKACTASYEWLQTLITTWHERETEMQVISNPSISITFQFVCFKIIKQQALSFISKSFFLLNKYMYQLSSDCKRKSIFFLFIPVSF